LFLTRQARGAGQFADQRRKIAGERPEFRGGRLVRQHLLGGRHFERACWRQPEFNISTNTELWHLITFSTSGWMDNAVGGGLDSRTSGQFQIVVAADAVPAGMTKLTVVLSAGFRS
jgi:hypothetical protein